MKSLLSTIFLLLTIESFGQGFFTMDTLNVIPNEIKGLPAGTLRRGFKVDFNGDGKKDFIFEIISSDSKTPANIEYWITSEFVIVKKMKKYGQGYDYFWFINLDSDIEPEIFRANGYEDGIDYAIYDHDLKTGKENVVFYLNPVIIENGKTYWGYPWDISDMIIKNENEKIFLKASVDHDIERDGEITIPDPSKKFPVIFFYGHSTQPNINVGQIRNTNWMLIEDLR